MNDGLSYPAVLSPFERMHFVEKLHHCYTTYEKRVLLRLLFDIIKLDDNSVVKHEAVFLLGMLYDYFREYEDEITNELISIVKREQSIVLHHEIVETLGHFTNKMAIQFVENSLKSDNSDILDTAIISEGRQKYNIAKQRTRLVQT